MLLRSRRVMENVSKAPVQRESQKEAMFETPASDSDSGDSLFLTQSVTSPSRTVKRLRPSNTQACPFNQEAEDEQVGSDDPHAQSEDASNSDSESSYGELLHKWKSRVKTRNRVGHQPRSRRRHTPPKRMVLPFLKSSGSELLSSRQSRTIVSSEIGGFFKCMLKLDKGHGDRRRELSPSSEWEQNSTEENTEDHEDIRKVNTEYFVLSGSKRNRQTWLPSLKWKTSQTPRKCTKKLNKTQEVQKKCSQTRKDSEDLMEPQDDTDIHNESNSFDIEESQSKLKGEKSKKSSARSSLSPCSSPSCLSPDKSPFLRSLFMDHQEEHSENQPQVLVTCSQSQSLDWHQAQNIDQACENLIEPIDELAVKETQWPSSAEQDEDETQILEDNPIDRDGGEDAVCSENISFSEHQVQDEDKHEGVHHEPVGNENLGSVSGGFTSSQDLFQKSNNEASPLKETSVENHNNGVLESSVVPHDDSIITAKKRCSLILAGVEADYVTYSKSQRTQPAEIVSPTAGNMCQESKENNDSVVKEHPSLPLEDISSGSRRNDFSTPSKDILMVRQEGKAETPLFVYGGLKFLKRKKGKKTQAPEISDNLAPVQADLGQNEGSGIVKQKKRKKDKSDGLLEEPVDTLPEISVPADLHLSVQDSSVVCDSVNEIKLKKKRKKDKNDGLLEEPVDTLPEISVPADLHVSVQDSSVVCDSVNEIKLKKKRKKDKHDGLLEEPVNILPEISVSADLHLSVQDCSLVCDSVSGIKPKKKRKKDKNDGLLEEPVDTLPEISVSADLHLSVQDCSLVCDSVSGIKPKKKRKKDKHDGLLEEPVDTLPEISVPADLHLSVQESSVVCDSVSEIKLKKKRKKDKNDGLLEEPVDTLPEISVPADLHLSVQDCSLVCDSVSGIKPKKKRKKDKHDGLLEEPVDTLPEISVPADLHLSVQDSSVVCDSVSEIKLKKKRKKDKHDGLLKEPVDTLPEISVPADLHLSVQDCSLVCDSVSGIKPKKKRKKDKNDGLLEKSVDTLPEVSISADSGLSFQHSYMVSASAGGSKPKKKIKKYKHDQPVPREDEWIGEEEAVQIPCEGSASLVTIHEETEQLAKTDLSSPSMSHEVSQLDSSTNFNKHLVQSDDHSEPRRKKKKEVKKSDSRPVMSDEMIASQCNEGSHSSHGTKTVKKKKQKFLDHVGEGQVGVMTTASKDLAESLNKIFEIPAGIEIQAMNSIDLKPDDSVPPRKKKKKQRQEMFREEKMDFEASLVESTEQVDTPDTFQDSEQQTAEMVPLRKVKKQKKKKHRTEECQEEEASMYAPMSLALGLGDMTTSDTPSTRSEPGGMDEEEGFGGSEPAKKKKKKKKRKELENNGSWSVSHSLVGSYNTEQTTAVEKSSNSGQKLGKEKPAPCLEMQLTNDTKEKKKHEKNEGDDSECRQQILQSEDTIEPKRKKKKKKKRLVEIDKEMYPEIVEHESGSPSEASESKIDKKKKKNTKDTFDTGENESLDVLPEVSVTEEPQDVLVTCYAKEDSISSSGGELLVGIKKKKKKKQV